MIGRASLPKFGVVNIFGLLLSVVGLVMDLGSAGRKTLPDKKTDFPRARYFRKRLGDSIINLLLSRKLKFKKKVLSLNYLTTAPLNNLSVHKLIFAQMK